MELIMTVMIMIDPRFIYRLDQPTPDDPDHIDGNQSLSRSIQNPLGNWSWSIPGLSIDLINQPMMI